MILAGYLMVLRSSRWQTIFKFYKMVCAAKSFTVTKHVRARKVTYVAFITLCFGGENVKIFSKFPSKPCDC